MIVDGDTLLKVKQSLSDFSPIDASRGAMKRRVPANRKKFDSSDSTGIAMFMEMRRYHLIGNGTEIIDWKKNDNHKRQTHRQRSDVKSSIK